MDPVADLMSAGLNGPCPYLGELSVTAGTCGYADGQMVVSDRWSMDVEVGVGSDEEHSLTDSPVSCAVVQGGGCVVQCNIWNEVVGGMKLSELSSFPPIYSLILLPYITQCACGRTCHGGNPGCPEWVCMDNIAKNGGFWKRKKAGGVGWSARVWQQEGGDPRAPEKVGWVADRS